MLERNVTYAWVDSIFENGEFKWLKNRYNSYKDLAEQLMV